MARDPAPPCRRCSTRRSTTAASAVASSGTAGSDRGAGATATMSVSPTLAGFHGMPSARARGCGSSSPAGGVGAGSYSARRDIARRLILMASCVKSTAVVPGDEVVPSTCIPTAKGLPGATVSIPAASVKTPPASAPDEAPPLPRASPDRGRTGGRSRRRAREPRRQRLEPPVDRSSASDSAQCESACPERRAVAEGHLRSRPALHRGRALGRSVPDQHPALRAALRRSLRRGQSAQAKSGDGTKLEDRGIDIRQLPSWGGGRLYRRPRRPWLRSVLQRPLALSRRPFDPNAPRTAAAARSQSARMGRSSTHCIVHLVDAGHRSRAVGYIGSKGELPCGSLGPESSSSYWWLLDLRQSARARQWLPGDPRRSAWRPRTPKPNCR